MPNLKGMWLASEESYWDSKPKKTLNGKKHMKSDLGLKSTEKTSMHNANSSPSMQALPIPTAFI